MIYIYYYCYLYAGDCEGGEQQAWMWGTTHQGHPLLPAGGTKNNHWIVF